MLWDREQFILAQYFRLGLISDKTKSLFSAILEAGQAYIRYHPMLAEATVDYLDLLGRDGQALLGGLAFLDRRTEASQSLYSNSLLVASPAETPQHFLALSAAVQWALGHPDTRLALLVLPGSGPGPLAASTKGECSGEGDGDAALTCLSSSSEYNSEEISAIVHYLTHSLATQDPELALTLLEKVRLSFSSSLLLI